MKHLFSVIGLSLFSLLIGIGGLSAFHSPEPAKKQPLEVYKGKKPKNVILLIGDGMGLTQVSAGLYSNHNRLNIEQFPITGLIKTYSAKNLITDSGAGATAFACGCKTYNTAIGVDRHKKPCVTVLEQASQKGMATGLIVSCSITHATPAAFIAHVPDRADMESIATFFLKTPIDLMIGGGMNYFNKRKGDKQDLYHDLENNGYQVSNFTQQKLSETNPNPAHPFAWFSADEEPDNVEKGRDYLPVAARLAGPFLKKRSEKGFFMMLEGSQIDWACHKNDGPNAIREMLDFDAAIGEILKFAKADGETLVIITADHETGGMSIKQGSEMDSLNIGFNTEGHTAALVPVFAYGPGAELFGGIYENTGIHDKISALLGFEPIVEAKKK
ncbi:MAG: alkaline phosphatase [Bacteroidota bacterium]